VNIGIRVRVRDSRTYDDLGLATVPAPVEPDDLVVFEFGAPLPVTSVLPVPADATVVPVRSLENSLATESFCF